MDDIPALDDIPTLDWGTRIKYLLHRWKEYWQGEKLKSDFDVATLNRIELCTQMTFNRANCVKEVFQTVRANEKYVVQAMKVDLQDDLLHRLPPLIQRQALQDYVKNPHAYALNTDPEYREKVEKVAEALGQSVNEVRLVVENAAERVLQISAETLTNVSQTANQTASALMQTLRQTSDVTAPHVGVISQEEAAKYVENTANALQRTFCTLGQAGPEECKGVVTQNFGADFKGIFQHFDLGWWPHIIITMAGVYIANSLWFKYRQSTNSKTSYSVRPRKPRLKAAANQSSVPAAANQPSVPAAANQPSVKQRSSPAAVPRQESKAYVPPVSRVPAQRVSEPSVSVQRVSESKARVQRVAAKYRNTIDELVGTSFEKALENLVGWIAANLPPEGQKLTWSQSFRYYFPRVNRDIKETRQSVRGRLLVALLCADASELPPYHPCSRQFEPETQKEWDKLGPWEVEFYGEIRKLKNRDIQAQTKVAFLLHVLQNPTRWLNPKHWFGNGNIPRYEKSELLGYIYSQSSEYEQLLPHVLEILAARPLLLQTYLEDIIDAANESDFAFYLEKDIKAHTKAAGTATEIKESKWIYGPVWKSPKIDWAFVYYSLKPTNQEKVTADMLRANTRLSKDQLYWLSHNDIVWTTHLLEHRLQEGIQSRHQVFLPFDTSSTIFKPGVVHDQLWNLMVSGVTGLGGDISLGHLKVTLLQAAARLENEILEEHFLFTTGVFNQTMAPMVKASLDAGERAIPEMFQCRDFLMTPTVQQVQWLDSSDFRADSAMIMADRLVKETKTYAAYFTKVHGKEVDQKGDICKVHVLTTIETSVSFVKTPLFDECRQVHFQLRQEFPGWNAHLDRFNYYQPIQNGKYTMVVHQRKSVPALSKTVTAQMLTPAVLVKLLHTLHFVNQRQIMLHVSPDRIRYCPSSNVFFLELFYASRLNAPDLPPTWTTAFQEEKWAPLPAGLGVSQQQYAYLLLSWCIIKYPQFRAHWGTDKLVPEVRTHMNKLGPKNVESVLLHAALDGKDSIEFLINGCVLENTYDTIQELDRLHRWTLDLVAMHAKGQWACCTPELLKTRLERTHAMTMNAEGVVAPEIVKASKGMIPPDEPWTTAKDVKAFLKSIILLPQFLQTGVFDPVNLPFHAPTDLPMLLLNYEKPSSRQSREKYVTAEDCLEAVTETLWFLENATLLYAFCRRKDLSRFLSPRPKRLSLTRMELGEKIEVDIHLKLLYIEANTFDRTHWSE